MKDVSDVVAVVRTRWKKKDGMNVRFRYNNVAPNGDQDALGETKRAFTEGQSAYLPMIQRVNPDQPSADDSYLSPTGGCPLQHKHNVN